MVSLLLMLIWLQPATSQLPDLTVLKDTSYFREGADNWNLVESVIRGDHANVLFLLRRGADPDARAEGGMTALMFAAEKGDTLLVKMLVLNGAQPDLTFVEGTTPLMVAVLNQQFEVAHLLLKKGADPDHQDQFKGSPLLYASAMNNYQMADLLLFYGASDSIRDKEGNGPLMTSAYFGNIETADVLLQNGIDEDETDQKRNTPLMISAQQGDLDIIRLLLDYGASKEKVNKENLTPLGHAIIHQQDSAAMLLIDSGANIHHQVSTNRNIHDLSVLYQRKKVQKVLEERGASALPRPDFSEIDMGWGNSYMGGEHLMQIRVSWVDRKFGFFGETGFDFRPTFRKVQYEAENSLIRQYRQSMWIWAHGAGKQFRLLRDPNGMEYGAYAALYGMLAFPRNRGFDDNPSPIYRLAPAAGIYMSGRIAGLKAGVDRYKFGSMHEGAWKMNITLFVRIEYRSRDYARKEIYYD